MAVADLVSDLLTRVRNGGRARRRFIETQTSKLTVEVIRLLKENGFVEGYLLRAEKPQPMARIYLGYDAEREPVIRGLRRVSKLSCRRYVGYKEIPQVPGFGVAILSTSQGVMTGDEARKKRVGGELLCFVW